MDLGYGLFLLKVLAEKVIGEVPSGEENLTSGRLQKYYLLRQDYPWGSAQSFGWGPLIPEHKAPLIFFMLFSVKI